MNISNRKMLVELDALFDTVMGTLGALSPQMALKVVTSENYTYRFIDLFEGFDKQEFLDRYNKRDRVILKNSSVTPILRHVHDFTQRVMDKTFNSPVLNDCTIVVNTYPYVLEDSEKEIIRKILRHKLPLKPEIDFVHLALDKLNPFYISREFEAVILYNFNSWLKIFLTNSEMAEDFIKYPCFRVRFIAPAILASVEGLDPNVNLPNMFIETMEFLSPMIDLMFIPVEEFCSVLAYRKPKPSTPKDAGSDELNENIPIPEFEGAKPSRST